MREFDRASDAALFTDAERWIGYGMLAATCGKNDRSAILSLKHYRHRLRKLEAFADRNHELTAQRQRLRRTDESDGICIPEGKPDQEVRMVGRMVAELSRRAKESGEH